MIWTSLDLFQRLLSPFGYASDDLFKIVSAIKRFEAKLCQLSLSKSRRDAICIWRSARLSAQLGFPALGWSHSDTQLEKFPSLRESAVKESFADCDLTLKDFSHSVSFCSIVCYEGKLKMIKSNRSSLLPISSNRNGATSFLPCRPLCRIMQSTVEFLLYVWTLRVLLLLHFFPSVSNSWRVSPTERVKEVCDVVAS